MKRLNHKTGHGSKAARKGGLLLPLALLCLMLWPDAGVGLAASFNQSPLLGKQTQLARQDAQVKTGVASEQAPERVDAARERTRPAGPALPNSAEAPWRIRIRDAAAVPGGMVTFGDIAAPAGEVPAELWAKLSAVELWPAPDQSGKTANFTRPRLQQAIAAALGEDVAALCLYPASLTVQKGGRLMDAQDVRDAAVKVLTPLMAALPGEPELRDFRLPARIFLDHAGQRLELEVPAKLAPGRVSLRFTVLEADGSVTRRLSGSVFMDCWATVPSAAVPLGKGGVLLPEQVTFTRQNLAYLRELPWDGTGGPWRLARPIAPGQPILQSDLAHVPTVTKGKTVTLIYESGGVRLAVNAEALADGVKGESIPVRNLQSKRQVSAIVLDERTVLSSRSKSPASRLSLAGDARETGNF